MDNFLIRKIKKEDAASIEKIYSSIIQKPEEIDFRRIIEEQADSQGVVSFAAEIDDIVVGYMISYTISSGFGMDKSAWIAMLGVDPKHMGKGIGKKLAEAMFNYCREKKIKNIFTSVRWDSTDMLSFFKTLDFDRSDFINLRKVLD